MIIKSNQQFVKEETSAHWYQVTSDGTVKPRHDADLRVARKENLYASPTSIEKDVRANPQLMRWIKNEIAKAFVNNPRLPEELDQAYAERVLKIADGKRDFAANRGVAIHAAIEKGGSNDPEIQPFYEAYMQWERKHVLETLHSEVKLADDKLGVAGTGDKIVIHRGHGLMALDFKTKKIKKGEKALFYESYPRQLSFYARAYQQKYGQLPRIMSVVIDSETPSEPHERLYSMEEQAEAHKEFMCQVWLWCSTKKYWPVSKWSPSF